MNIYPYAGFWRRVLAHVIDAIVLVVPLFIFRFLTITIFPAAKQGGSTSFLDPTVLISAVMTSLSSFLVTWLYNAFMESSKYQASLGKMVLGLKVVGANGKRIGFGRATCRCLGRILSANFTLFFGYYMAGFTKHRQTLHDILTDTYVVEKTYEQTEQPLPCLPFHRGNFITSICVALLPLLLLALMIGLFVFLASNPH